jgi:hypothetical protein
MKRMQPGGGDGQFAGPVGHGCDSGVRRASSCSAPATTPATRPWRNVQLQGASVAALAGWSLVDAVELGHPVVPHLVDVGIGTPAECRSNRPGATHAAHLPHPTWSVNAHPTPTQPSGGTRCGRPVERST